VDEKRITELIKQLVAPDVEQRRLSAELLGRSRHYRALIPLQNALLDPDGQVRYRAAKSLVWHAGVNKGIKLMRHLDPEVRQGAVWAVDELRRAEESPDLIQALIQVLDDPDGGTRAAAVYVLGHLGGELALEPLVRALNDSHRLTSMNACDALGKLGDSRAVPALIQLLPDPESPRYLIVEALGKLGDRAALPYLHQLLYDPDSYVQDAVVRALIQLEGMTTALAFLQEPTENIRTTAVLWLMQQSEEALQPHVVELLGLLELAPADLCLPLIRVLAQVRDARAVPQLIVLLRHPNQAWRLAALQALHRIGNPQAILPVLLATKDNDGQVREVARRVLEALEDRRSKC